MVILPAIDLKGGRCVRLRQGRADEATVYGDDPVAMARQWEAEGGEWLHVVDLDGAFAGKPTHVDAIAKIARAVAIPVEAGGGLRTDADVRRVLDAGVARAIVGTRACSDPEAVGALAAAYGERLAVGIDARNGRVQVKGWVETTDLSAVELAMRMDALGVRTLIVTETSTDGMMQGTDVAGIDALCAAVSCGVIASGGIASEADVKALVGLRRANLVGAIVGKALYEGAVSLASLKACVRSLGERSKPCFNKSI